MIRFADHVIRSTEYSRGRRRRLVEYPILDNQYNYICVAHRQEIAIADGNNGLVIFNYKAPADDAVKRHVIWERFQNKERKKTT